MLRMLTLSTCNIFLLETICGALLLTSMFAAAGWPVSSQLDLLTDTFKPTDVNH